MNYGIWNNHSNCKWNKGQKVQCSHTSSPTTQINEARIVKLRETGVLFLSPTRLLIWLYPRRARSPNFFTFRCTLSSSDKIYKISRVPERTILPTLRANKPSNVPGIRVKIFTSYRRTGASIQNATHSVQLLTVLETWQTA